jgi:hypothetical protein
MSYSASMGDSASGRTAHIKWASGSGRLRRPPTQPARWALESGNGGVVSIRSEPGNEVIGAGSEVLKRYRPFSNTTRKEIRGVT